MRVTLAFPFSADPAMPHGALPLLKAILDRRGGFELRLKDLSLETFNDLLSREWLEEAARRAGARLEAGGLDASERGSVEAALGEAGDVVSALPAALDSLRAPESFYDPEELFAAKRTLGSAFALLSASTECTTFGKYSYSLRSYDGFDEVRAAVTAERGSLLDDYLGSVTVPSILAEGPEVLGLSVAYFSQIVPAFMLARRLREADPELRIVLGGPVPTWGAHLLSTDPRFGRYLDAVAVAEADESLPALLESWDSGERPEQAPGFVLYRDGSVRAPAPSPPVDLDSLPTPDYGALPLESYLAPERVLSVSPARGCYYNRCTFCAYAFTKLAPFRERSPELIVADVLAMREATGETAFCFETDALKPAYLGRLSGLLAEADAGIRWHGVARLEEELDAPLLARLARGGCSRLYLGLESGSQRLLDRMHKGTRLPVVSRILRDCRRHGISVEAGVFTGYPGETAEDAEATCRFVEEHREELTRCDIGAFRLLRGSPLARSPSAHGARLVGDPERAWCQLAFEEPDRELPSPGTPSPLARLESLYPETALVDVAEDLLYAARRPHGMLQRSFRG